MKPEVSPSQIKLARKCLRRWAFKYQEGYREAETEQQAFGKRFHTILENYLRDGTPIPGDSPEGRLAQIGLVHLPPPGTGYVEDGFRFDMGDFDFIGFVDWIRKDGQEVKDHKTTSNFKWALTSDELLKDPQGILYAAAGHDLGPIKLTWDYYRTKGAAKFKRVEADFSRWQLCDEFGKLTEETRGLVQLKSTKTLELPPSPEACFSYGRPCPHLDKCNLSPMQRISRIMISSEELLAQLRAKSAAGGAPQLPVAPVAAPQLPVAPVQQQLPVAPVAPPQLPVAPTQQLPNPLQHPQTTVNMPAYPATAYQPPLPVAQFGQGAPVLQPTVALPATQPVAALPAALPVQPATQPVAALPVQPATQPEPPKRRPGRPRKDATAAPVAPSVPVAPQPVAPQPVAPQPVAPQPVAPVADLPQRIGTLYVNCFPLGENVSLATDLFSEAKQIVKAELGLDHYKLGEYGKGPALFSIAVQAVVESKGYEQLYVDSRTPEGSDALETLMALSGSVVRGL
jgi:hypothetical protein